MEHIEEAGIHSGDSACALPPITLGRSDIARIREATEGIARGVGVRGLLNVQFALQSDVLYVIEANPRASRTVPFVAKATGVSLAKAAARVMLGETIEDLRAAKLLPVGDGARMPLRSHVAVKEAVLPFNRFVGVDTVLGPEMKSTGEVMGIDSGFGVAYAKSQAAAYGTLPTKGRVFVSVANRDKRAMVFPVKRLVDLGFEVLATDGTAEMLDRNGVRATVVPKFSEGLAGNAVERILAGEIDLVINTPFSTSGNTSPRVDGYEIRSACVAHEVPCVTTVQGASAAVQGIEAVIRGDVGVKSLQEWNRELAQLREDEL
jgi:carbamoyl-phosphate synthase large subunit